MPDPTLRDPTPEELATVLCFFDRLTTRLDAPEQMRILLEASDEMVVSELRSCRDRGRMIRKALSMLNQDFRYMRRNDGR